MLLSTAKDCPMAKPRIQKKTILTESIVAVELQWTMWRISPLQSLLYDFSSLFCFIMCQLAHIFDTNKCSYQAKKTKTVFLLPFCFDFLYKSVFKTKTKFKIIWCFTARLGVSQSQSYIYKYFLNIFFISCFWLDWGLSIFISFF